MTVGLRSPIQRRDGEDAPYAGVEAIKPNIKVLAFSHTSYASDRGGRYK